MVCAARSQEEKPLTFEDRYQQTCYWVDKRRRKWDLANVPWEDARQLVLIRVSKKLHLYEPEKGEYSHWLNRLISNEFRRIWRNCYTKWARPCVLGCAFNPGGDQCTKTPSGRQCSECPLYRDWQFRKEDQHNIMQALPLDNHSQEVHSTPADSIDISAAKTVIETRMKERLTRAEWRAYKMLYIQEREDAEVAVALGFKAKPGKETRMFPGYQVVLSLKHRLRAMVREIIEEEGLSEPSSKTVLF